MESVNSPLLYTSGEIQAIDAMRSAFGSDELKMFCKISAFKYIIWRSSLHHWPPPHAQHMAMESKSSSS
eukprot:COSAG05_NODE_873_length_6834_cov_14.862422_3_plen_69_part_00